ncbi:MAG: GNAT family N-acetyltransferase, partial [Mesorhizobium sp.]
AICIREDRKHLGVSWELLGYVARYADDHGIETIESIESRENRAAIELEREMGFIVTTDPDDPTLVLVQRKLGASLPG